MSLGLSGGPEIVRVRLPACLTPTQEAAALGLCRAQLRVGAVACAPRCCGRHHRQGEKVTRQWCNRPAIWRWTHESATTVLTRPSGWTLAINLAYCAEGSVPPFLPEVARASMGASALEASPPHQPMSQRSARALARVWRQPHHQSQPPSSWTPAVHAVVKTKLRRPRPPRRKRRVVAPGAGRPWGMAPLHKD